MSAALHGQHTVWHRAKVALLSHFASRLRYRLQEERCAGQAALQAAFRREEALAQQLRNSEQVCSLRCTGPGLCEVIKEPIKQ